MQLNVSIALYLLVLTVEELEASLYVLDMRDSKVYDRRKSVKQQNDILLIDS